VHLFSVFSLRNRALIALVTIVIGIFGGIALTSFKQELIPSISLPSVYIVTAYPGASPDVVNTDVSTPIESALQGIENLDSTTATSNTSASTVTASFAYGTDITTSEQKVQLALDRIKTILPSGVTPQVITFSLSDFPVIQLAVTSDMDQNTLASKLSTLTVTNLKQLTGVSDVSLLGAASQRVTITPDSAKLAADGLNIQSIKTALGANGTLLASGSITEDSKTLTVQSGSRITTTDEIAALPLLGARAATVPTIADVATVAVVNDPTTGYSSVNGKPAVTLNITKSAAGNTVSVSGLVRNDIPTLERQLGGNTKFTVVSDQAPSITQSIDSLAQEGLLGLVFAVVIILVFLFSVRSTLVTAISIPVSVLITFIGMQASGYTLNVITLAALTIAIGRVVDDSIVVIENIKRHIGLGEEKLPAILTAVREVATAVTASTITTVAVFLPIALVGGLTGELFRPFALTVTMALLSSLFVSLTIVPVLAYWFLGNKKAHKHAGAAEHAETEAPEGLPPGDPLDPQVPRDRAGRGPRPARGHRVARLGPQDQLHRQQRPEYAHRDPDPSARHESRGAGCRLDEGRDGASQCPGCQDRAAHDRIRRQRAARRVRRRRIEHLLADDGSECRPGETAEHRHRPAEEDHRAGRTRGRDRAGRLRFVRHPGQRHGGQRRRPAHGVRRDSRQGQGPQHRRPRLEQPVGVPAVHRRSDRSREGGRRRPQRVAGRRHRDPGDEPERHGQRRHRRQDLSIYVDNASAPTTTAQLTAFSIPTARGIVPLSDLATIETVNGPSSITTIKGLRSATLTVTPGTDNTGSASAVVSAAVSAVKLPASATATLGGVTTQQSDSFSQLGLALLAAILIVYVVMVATFKSLRQPLLLLVSIPFAATGAIALQVISGIPLGVASLIGVLMLIGIVVTNAIVLVDLINQYRNRGMKVGEAIIHGASRRLRPILMTALATIFALLPLGIGLTGHGGFISQPLAIVVIGGLVSSTLLTLIVLPVLYYLVEGAKERRIDRRAARASAETDGARSASSAARGTGGTLSGHSDADSPTVL
jgi:HAE1 family hydrophobic/amphiphilic exporter-1